MIKYIHLVHLWKAERVHFRWRNVFWIVGLLGIVFIIWFLLSKTLSISMKTGNRKYCLRSRNNYKFYK